MTTFDPDLLDALERCTVPGSRVSPGAKILCASPSAARFDVLAPLEELAQVRSVGLQDAAAVTGQEPNPGQLGLIEPDSLTSDMRRVMA